MVSRIFLLLSLLFVNVNASLAFISPVVRLFIPASRGLLQQNSGFQNCLTLRGGDQDLSNSGGDSEATPASSSASTATKGSHMSAMSAVVLAGAQHYSRALESSPIVTKSITAGFIFVASDLLAQNIEKGEDKERKLDMKRTIGASLVGLLYFGPAAHFWYENIFLLFPGTSLFSTLQKAAMGQLFFGPSFTCIFFATSLLQSGNFSFGNWYRKIRSDLFGAWLAGVGFWPLVDLVSYSLVPRRWIPLFINVCSLVWNVYLSIVANRKAKST